MTITRTGTCPSFLDYVTKFALIPAANSPSQEFHEITKYNFRWITIPAYQRGLVWAEETFEELLDSGSAFLGNAILGAFPLPTPRGNFSGVPDAASEYEVLIDGLQRFSFGTALLNIFHVLVLADHPLRAADAPQFASLRKLARPFAPVYEHNDRELKEHKRIAVRESYREFYRTLSIWVENELSQGRAAELAKKVQQLFLERQIAPDTYYGFRTEFEVTSTFIGLNTVRVQLSIVDWLRSVIVDRGSSAGWDGNAIARIDNTFTEVFTRETATDADLIPFASLVLDTLNCKGEEAKIFPSWDNLLEAEVDGFLSFVDKLKATNGSTYYDELRQCGKLPYAACLSYYYRRYLATGQYPSFVSGGVNENAELHTFLRANLRALLAGRIGRTREFAEELLREQSTLDSVADEISDFAVGIKLSANVDESWLRSSLKLTNQQRSPRVFNACLLPVKGDRGADFVPHRYGKKATVYQVDHMIPESVIKQHANDPGAPEARTILNFAPIRRTANVAQSNLSCAGKLAAGGSYANELINDPNVHPYVRWLVEKQAACGALLDQMARLQPNSDPDIAKQRVDWLVKRLLPRL